MSLVIPNNATDFKTNLGLGTAADVDVGTSAGNAIQLGAGGALPAVDGSNLTGMSISADYSPIYAMRATSDPNLSDSVAYSLLTIMGTPSLNPNSAINTSTGKFTPTVAGHYVITGVVRLGSGYSDDTPDAGVWITKNGTTARGSYQWDRGGTNRRLQYGSITFFECIYLNGSTDYIETWVYANTISYTPALLRHSTWGAYRLGDFS